MFYVHWNSFISVPSEVRLQVRRLGPEHRRPEVPTRGARRGRGPGPILSSGTRWHCTYRGLRRRSRQRFQRRRLQERAFRPQRARDTQACGSHLHQAGGAECLQNTHNSEAVRRGAVSQERPNVLPVAG